MYTAVLVDSLLLLLFLAMVAAGVLGVWSLWPDRHLLRQRRRRAGGFGLILAMAVVGGRGLGGGGARREGRPPAQHSRPAEHAGGADLAGRSGDGAAGRGRGLPGRHGR